MDYEVLYDEMQKLEKQMKDKLTQMQKLGRGIKKDMDGGDLRNLYKDLSTLAEVNRQQAEMVRQLAIVVEGFDARSYFANGDFAEQMLAYCKAMKVDVKGEYPVYEMFPYRVRFDTENQDIYLDRKKIQCVRPKSFVETVKTVQTRLMKASFNAQSFVNELADAYDMAVLKRKKAANADIYLTDLYKYLAPMSRFRRDYDKQSFAFDVARLYNSDVETTKNGRRFQFGLNQNSKALRILDGDGNEQYLATIRFYKDQE